MGFFFQGYNVVTVLTLLALIVCVLLANEITRRSKIVSVVTFVVIPIIIFVLCVPLKLLGSPSGQTWFGWVKAVSALVGVLGFMAIRFTSFGKKKYAYYFPVAIFGLNIVEAVYRDIEVYLNYQTPTWDEAGLYLQGGPWNLINAVAGVFLLLSMTGWMGIKVAKTKSQDMIWPDQLWFMIIAYDLWNISYCYNSISTRAMYAGVAIIIACSLGVFFGHRGAWLQDRAQTLAIFATFSLVVDYQQFDAFGITSTYNPNAMMVVAILSLLANFSVFVYNLYIVYKYKKNPLKEEMYTHLSGYQKTIQANNLEA